MKTDRKERFGKRNAAVRHTANDFTAYANRKRSALCAALLCLCLAGAAAADSYTYTAVKPEIVSPRLSAMGGANPALAAGADTFSTNPAAFAYTEKQVRVLGLATELSGQFLDIPDILNDDDPTDAMLRSVRKNDGVYFGLNATGPISLAIVNKNFGFGLFNRTFLAADLASVTYAEITGGEEFLVTGAYGVTLLDTKSHELSAGIQVKGFYQLAMYESGTVATIVDVMNDFDINGQPLSSTFGFGLDVGLMYRFADQLSVGLVCRDLYTPIFYTVYDSFDNFTDGTKRDGTSTEYDTLDRDLSLGAAWLAPIPRSWHTVTDFTLSAGYNDILAPFTQAVSRNPVLNFTMGAEVTFFDILSLRAGIRDCYPAAGLGLDFRFFKLDLAVYGLELGLEPGDRAVYNMALGLSFGF